MKPRLRGGVPAGRGQGMREGDWRAGCERRAGWSGGGRCVNHTVLWSAPPRSSGEGWRGSRVGARSGVREWRGER